MDKETKNRLTDKAQSYEAVPDSYYKKTGSTSVFALEVSECTEFAYLGIKRVVCCILIPKHPLKKDKSVLFSDATIPRFNTISRCHEQSSKVGNMPDDWHLCLHRLWR